MLERLLKKLLIHIFTNQKPKKVTDKTLKLEIDSHLPIKEKVKQILSKMSFDEKIDLITGEKMFAISPIERLGLSRVWCSDASSGIRSFGRSTSFPALVALTASWNRELLNEVGQIIAEECRAKGISVLLGPGVNIYRVPTNGRNFEYMGEDPHLASQLVVPYIKGAQDRGVITTVKHFVANNSEYDRHRMNSIIDERTLNEIYFPAFKAAVQEGKSKGIMCAYNLLNGIHCSEHKKLLTDVLRERWGFNGFVISDWNCLYSTEGPMKAGLDLEMPKPKYYSKKKVEQALVAGDITLEAVNEKVKNILRSLFEIGAYERPVKDKDALEFGEYHDEVALKAARESIVLLKNQNNLLPIDPKSNKKIVILGRNATSTPTTGGGSCYVKPYKTRNIYQAIKCTQSNHTINLIKQKKGKISNNSKQLVGKADYVILCVGFTNEEDSECWDRPWKMTNNQNELIQQVSSLNENTIVILSAGGGIETESWVHKIPALIHSFYLGQSVGDAIADVIFGKTNPSAKLPFTMAKKWEDISSTKFYVEKPQTTSFNKIRQRTKEKFRFYSSITLEYKEGIMVGYRHFDTANIEPQFPFGHGLSYTKFDYIDLKLNKKSLSRGDTLKMDITLKNTGPRRGKEVIQVYVKDIKSSVVRPEKELRGFAKIDLKPDEERKINIEIPINNFAFYDVETKEWVVEEGEFDLQVGSSSRDIKLKERIIVK